MRHYAASVATLEDKILQRAVVEVLNGSYVCQGGRMTFRLPHFWGLRVVSRTGLLLVCGQDRDGPLEMERASSYEVTPSRSGMGPGTADESFAGQQVRGSRISGQAAPGAFGRYPAARRSWR